jgi:hypothetical protein
MRALFIAHFKDYFERPRIFRPCTFHVHTKIVLKSISEEVLQQYFEQWRTGLTIDIAEQVDGF